MILQFDRDSKYTPEEFLEIETQSDERHEYINGQIFRKSRKFPNHNLIAGNLLTELNVALKREPYSIFASNLRLWTPNKRIYTYPDVMIMAEPIQYQEGRRDTLINPLLIAEVLSKPTGDYDKASKFSAYRTIPAFQEYLLVDQYSIRIEHYTKDGNRWILVDYEDENAEISLSSVPCRILVSDLYNKVDFAEVQAEESDSI